MSADVLRAAAALMRNRAQAADSGPWKWAEQTHGEWYGIQSEFAALGNAFDPGNAFHIASWHPAVALAVADWLEATAADLADNSVVDAPEAGEGHWPNPDALWCDYCGGAIESTHYSADDQRCKCDRWHKAFAVARAYIGEQP